MNDVPLWLSILLYAVAAIAAAIVLYLLMLYAMKQALREPLAELRTARRRQEDLLREISTSAAYVADVADVWAENEAERRVEAGGAAGSEAADEVDPAREAFGPSFSDADEPDDAGDLEPADLEPADLEPADPEPADLEADDLDAHHADADAPSSSASTAG